MTLTTLALAATLAPQGTVPAVAIKPKEAPKPVTATLSMDQEVVGPVANRRNMMKTYPSFVRLLAERPAGVLKEPEYRAKPLYGALRVGDGPKSVFYFAVEDPEGAQGRIYIDLNGNGDLTDDGSPVWTEAKDVEGVLSYSRLVTLRASWGGPIAESESSPYTLNVYRRHGTPQLNYVRAAGRMGTVTLAGKERRVALVDNQSDALYTVPKPGDRTRKPVWLLIDLNGDGGFAPTSAGRETFDLAQPFQIEGQWYEGFPSLSGGELTLAPVRAPGEAAAPAPPRVTMKQAGEIAPDFVAQTVDGKPLKLSDFKGKVVLLDFWATWCGPCLVSMPGLEEIYREVKDQNVVVLSVNVYDAKDPFDKWVARNAGSKYSFTFAYDPAERDQAKSIAGSRYGVYSIPTMFVIDREGKISSVVVGSGNEKRLVEALGKVGVRAKAR